MSELSSQPMRESTAGQAVESKPTASPADRITEPRSPAAHRAMTVESLTALHDAGFDLEDAVAAGGFGVVYRARDRRLQREVAVKVLDLQAVQRVGAPDAQQEIQTLATLRHPHIVPLYESGAVGTDLLYLVMPWIEGASLRARLRRETRLQVREVLRLGIDLADALEALHTRGLVHRDIKPENVLLDGQHAMVIDFGLVCTAHAAIPSTADGEPLIGTPAYMSPEQWVRGGAIDGRADVFGLGCLLYELLAGRPPFERPPLATSDARSAHRWSASLRTMDQFISAGRAWGGFSHRTAPALRETRRDVPSALDRLLQRAMQPDLSRRLASAHAFRTTLQHIQAEELNGGQGRQTRRVVVASAAALAVIIPSAVSFNAQRVETERLLALSPRRLLVTPVLNATGDRRYDSLASSVSLAMNEALASELTRRPDSTVGDIAIITAPSAPLPLDITQDPVAVVRPLALQQDAGIVVTAHVTREAERVVVRGALIDARNGTQRALLPPTTLRPTATGSELRAVTDSFAAAIASSLRNNSSGQQQ